MSKKESPFAPKDPNTCGVGVAGCPRTSFHSHEEGALSPDDKARLVSLVSARVRAMTERAREHALAAREARMAGSTLTANFHEQKESLSRAKLADWARVKAIVEGAG